LRAGLAPVWERRGTLRRSAAGMRAVEERVRPAGAGGVGAARRIQQRLGGLEWVEDGGPGHLPSRSDNLSRVDGGDNRGPFTECGQQLDQLVVDANTRARDEETTGDGEPLSGLVEKLVGVRPLHESCTQSGGHQRRLHRRRLGSSERWGRGVLRRGRLVSRLLWRPRLMLAMRAEPAPGIRTLQLGGCQRGNRGVHLKRAGRRIRPPQAAPLRLALLLEVDR